MAWTVEYDPRAIRDLNKLGRAIRVDIFDYMQERIAGQESPRRFGKALRHDKFGLWRYRVRDYRIVCELQDDRRIVLVIGVGHRRNIYD